MSRPIVGIPNLERKASKGKYRVIGEDRFSYEDFFVGDYDTKEAAFDNANTSRVQALKDATNASIADAYYVFDDKGRYLGRGYDFEKISRAIRFAMQAHGEEQRKGTSIPYAVHPIDVLSILLKEGADEDLAIAGVLHDVVEDTRYTLEQIKEEFGDIVAQLVYDVSEPSELTRGVSPVEKRGTWKLRKSQKIGKIKLASKEVKLLVCADKLANVRDMQIDYHNKGDSMWSRFNASKEEQAWYYNSVAEALGLGVDISSTIAYKDLVRAVREIFV